MTHPHLIYLVPFCIGFGLYAVIECIEYRFFSRRVILGAITAGTLSTAIFYLLRLAIP